MRGHRNEKKSGNIWNLLWLLGRYNADINTYFNSESSTKYLSPDIQNEMLKILSQMILRKLIAAIKQSPEFYQIYKQCRQITSLAVTSSLIAGETSDICNQEQVSICIRYCTNTLQSDGIFHGFYETCKTAATTIRDYPSNSCKMSVTPSYHRKFKWIQELASALTTDQDTVGKELFAECKEQALHIKINLPVIPRVCRAFTDKKVEEYYVDLFRHVFEKAASF